VGVFIFNKRDIQQLITHAGSKPIIMRTGLKWPSRRNMVKQITGEGVIWMDSLLIGWQDSSESLAATLHSGNWWKLKQQNQTRHMQQLT